MSTSEYGEAFLLAQFRAFYTDVVRLKRMVQTGAWVFSPDHMPEPITDVQTYLHTTTTVWQALLSVLEQQELTAGKIGGDYGVMLYKEAQYVMAVLADEIFLHLDWDGKEAWQTNLLETQLFHTQSAGVHFFQKLDKLLQHRDPVYTDVAKIYLMALALGFQGKFRGTNDMSLLDRYRRQLFVFIAQREPDLHNTSRPLFPNAYRHTQDEGRAPRLPDARKWIGLLAGLILTLVVVSSGLWIHLSTDLHSVIKRIHTAQ